MYTEVEANSFTEGYISILESALEGTKQIKDITVLTPEEQAQINSFNDTEHSYEIPENTTLYSLFEEQAEKNEEKVCVIANDKEITFKEFMDIMDIPVGGNTERKIEECVETLGNKSFVIIEPDGKEKELFWVNPDVTRVDWTEKMIYIQLNRDLEKYLLNLDGNFTSFQLGFVTNFKGKY
jgi:hypothetical protein